MDFNIAIPKNFTSVAADELAADIKDGKAVVVDVRGEDFKGGNIVGSEQCSYDNFDAGLTALFEKHKDKERVVFVCMYGKLRSPSAALDFIRLGGNNSADKVFVLSGGFQSFVSKYSEDDKLVEKFDKSVWSDEFLHVCDTEILSSRGALSPKK
eukprot:TRINITY_DN201_c1_g1_i1.p1 TRINITY_DN201_c1_g1~~TRINITY_DN201_c1_g1_i1.p1  ORF type:complete len:167 (-),score=58.14 TRINITY_DN201_c1_g1_i1:161-622(-)